jgi:hypothetical protein
MDAPSIIHLPPTERITSRESLPSQVASSIKDALNILILIYKGLECQLAAANQQARQEIVRHEKVKSLHFLFLLF